MKKTTTNADANLTTTKRIASILFDLESPGDFGVGGAARKLPSFPGMEINGIDGHIPLPINGSVATQLKTVACVTPFGEGFDTVVDKTVRKEHAWQINGQHISFSHPKWKSAVQALANRAVLKLGCDRLAVVEPILYKALLYEKGGHLKPHKDTEKEDNAFATLVIQLPSRCTGGTLSMQHGKDTKMARFGQDESSSSYKAHYAAFYADVEHCFEPVTSGYHLSLTYSLCWKSPDITIPRLFTTSADRLAPVLTSWSSVPGRYDGPIGIVLEHEYTDSYFSKGMNKVLKGRDLEVIKAIQSHNKHLPSDTKLAIVIANVQRNMSEYFTGDRYHRDEEEDWEEGDCYEQVNNVYDMGGMKTERAFDFDDLELIDVARGDIIGKNDNEWWGLGDDDYEVDVPRSMFRTEEQSTRST